MSQNKDASPDYTIKARIKSQNIICIWKCEVVTQCQIQKLVQVISALSRNYVFAKNIPIVWLPLQKEVRLNGDSMKKSSREAEKLDLSSQLSFLNVLSNSTIFPDSKNKKHKGNSVDIGAWPRTIMNTEHAEACQKCANLSRFSPVHGDWEEPVGFLQGNTDHQLCICQAVLNSTKTQMCLHGCHKAPHPVHSFYPNNATAPILYCVLQLRKGITSPEISQAEKLREIK